MLRWVLGIAVVILGVGVATAVAARPEIACMHGGYVDPFAQDGTGTHDQPRAPTTKPYTGRAPSTV